MNITFFHTNRLVATHGKLVEMANESLVGKIYHNGIEWILAE